MSFTSSQLFAASLLSFSLYVLLRRKRRHPYPYPPGPKSLPLIGNLRDVPFKYQWVTYETWGRETGECIIILTVLEAQGSFFILYSGSDIVHAELFGTHLVVLNSVKAASDLLDKQSSIYSDRCASATLARLFPLTPIRPQLKAMTEL
jgi:hypothetical protein